VSAAAQGTGLICVRAEPHRRMYVSAVPANAPDGPDGPDGGFQGGYCACCACFTHVALCMFCCCCESPYDTPSGSVRVCQKPTKSGLKPPDGLSLGSVSLTDPLHVGLHFPEVKVSQCRTSTAASPLASPSKFWQRLTDETLLSVDYNADETYYRCGNETVALIAGLESDGQFATYSPLLIILLR
jgi:hypothetical protein